MTIFLENSSDALSRRPGLKNDSMNCYTTPEIKTNLDNSWHIMHKFTS
jgi:hypothetical protein